MKKVVQVLALSVIASSVVMAGGYKIPEQSLTDRGLTREEAVGLTVYKGSGCRNCADTGYKGRVALYEVMPFWDPLKEMVLNGASTAELKMDAIKLGMQSLRMSGLVKLKDGVSRLILPGANLA